MYCSRGTYSTTLHILQYIFFTHYYTNCGLWDTLMRLNNTKSKYSHVCKSRSFLEKELLTRYLRGPSIGRFNITVRMNSLYFFYYISSPSAPIVVL